MAIWAGMTRTGAPTPAGWIAALASLVGRTIGLRASSREVCRLMIAEILPGAAFQERLLAGQHFVELMLERLDREGHQPMPLSMRPILSFG
jgi:hypothetical protein